eukprot:GHVH01017498.1.p1 GENE.GHVH01017498.1~~GHVH01017498.1.p1  ORF type:complete len:220 (+),score=35.05 GHVH01017498.1:45-704(+)
MPKAGRRKAPLFSKVRKKDQTWKLGLMDSLSQEAQTHKNIVVCEIHNDNNNALKSLREALKTASHPSPMMAVGKGKVKAALKDLPGVEKLFPFMQRRTALIFTDMTSSALKTILDKHQVDRPASMGAIATETVVLKAGYEDLSQFPHTLEERFRIDLGLPTKLDDGKILLLGDHVVCQEGKKLTANQALMLKHLGYTMSRFYVEPKAVLSLKGGALKKL